MADSIVIFGKVWADLDRRLEVAKCDPRGSALWIGCGLVDDLVQSILVSLRLLRIMFAFEW